MLHGSKPPVTEKLEQAPSDGYAVATLIFQKMICLDKIQYEY
jgi:hypothetical protein